MGYTLVTLVSCSSVDGRVTCVSGLPSLFIFMMGWRGKGVSVGSLCVSGKVSSLVICLGGAELMPGEGVRGLQISLSVGDSNVGDIRSLTGSRST